MSVFVRSIDAFSCAQQGSPGGFELKNQNVPFSFNLPLILAPVCNFHFFQFAFGFLGYCWGKGQERKVPPFMKVEQPRRNIACTPPTPPMDKLIYRDTTSTQSITALPDSRLRFNLHATLSLVAPCYPHHLPDSSMLAL